VRAVTDTAVPPGLWHNPAFQRLVTATTVSTFGSFITRMALPLVAILMLGTDAFGVALVRSMDLIAGLVVGLAAGAWVDRLRRRPVLVWTDLGRAALLATIPLAWLAGVLSFAQLLIVALTAAALATINYAADHAYLPTVVGRQQLVPANSALTASESISEFTGFGVSGFLVGTFGGPLAIALDAATFVFSAVTVASIRTPEPPPDRAARRNIRAEIAEGLQLVSHQPLLRAVTLASMATSVLWGIFGATWVIFAIEQLGLNAAAVGVIAAIGGIGSFFGAVVAARYTARIGLGRLMIVSLLAGALGNLLIPLAPAGAPFVAFGFLASQQLIGDAGMTAFDISEVSVRQTVTDDRQLGRVNATIRFAMLLAQLVATLAAGVLAVVIGLRFTLFLAPLGALVAAAIIWLSPLRRMRALADYRSEKTYPSESGVPESS
jgi:MFS family permease